MRIIAALLLLCVSAVAQQRIISTSPSITETLFALGVGNRVVGVSTYCHHPAQIQKLPRVGTYLKPNIEVIARLKPDLVIVQRLPNSSREQLQGLSIPVAEVDSGDLRRNLDSILKIGGQGFDRQDRGAPCRLAPGGPGPQARFGSLHRGAQSR
jgi:iron complex transport system substrate-binding protein